MSQLIRDLHPVLQPIACAVIARLVERRLMVIIVDTLRTEEEHQANLLSGNSWTSRSLHLDGLAIDLAPVKIYELHGGNKIQWDAADPAWRVIGEVGEEFGLDWGGRWRKPDPGHLEMARGRRLAALMEAP